MMTGTASLRGVTSAITSLRVGPTVTLNLNGVFAVSGIGDFNGDCNPSAFVWACFTNKGDLDTSIGALLESDTGTVAVHKPLSESGVVGMGDPATKLLPAW